VVTGDVTRGNFSNVRTAIIQFRRHVKQWRANVMAFQLNRVIWSRFVEVAVLAGVIDLPKFDENPLPWLQCESFAPPLEMIEGYSGGEGRDPRRLEEPHHGVK